MFDQLFKYPRIIERHLNASLLEERLRYLTHCREQGARRPFLRKIAQIQIHAIKYLDLERNVQIIPIEKLKIATKKWALNEMKRPCYKDSSFSGCKKLFFVQTRNWLKFLGRIEIPIQTDHIQITEFANHLRKEKNLSEITINNYCRVLRLFFNQCREEPVQFFNHLTPAYLDKLLIQKLHQGTYARETISAFISSVRGFLRYAESRGWCQTGIADSIHAPRRYSHQSLPSSPSWEDVQRLIKTSEGNSPKNIRDRAILLLLAVYGLRDSEVRQLRLENFDWDQKIFYLKHSKNGPLQKFPIVPTVGQAIARYIKKVRPQNTIRKEIFLTLRAPFRPLANLFSIVYYRWEPFNVAINHHGAHALRHACATRLINQGVSLKIIADQLGHRNLDSTRIYAKVDLTRLREVANFNIGDLL